MYVVETSKGPVSVVVGDPSNFVLGSTLSVIDCLCWLLDNSNDIKFFLFPAKSVHYRKLIESLQLFHSFTTTPSPYHQQQSDRYWNNQSTTKSLVCLPGDEMPACQ